MKALAPIPMDDDFSKSSGDYWVCPSCREEIVYEVHWGLMLCDYCPHCGQEIDWSEIK